MSATKKRSEPQVKEPESSAVSPSTSAELLMDEESEYGTVRISENVIAAVVRKYTLEVDGVVRFAAGSIVGGLAEMIGRKNYESSVVVDLEGEAVNITVTLVLRFGVRIPEVAALVQDLVRMRVEELTGKHVARVDVIVQDLEDTPTAQDKIPDEAAASAE